MEGFRVYSCLLPFLACTSHVLLEKLVFCKLAAAVAPPEHRLCTPSRLCLTPILSSRSQLRRIFMFLVVVAALKIYFVQSFFMSASLQYRVNSGGEWTILVKFLKNSKKVLMRHNKEEQIISAIPNKEVTVLFSIFLLSDWTVVFYVLNINLSYTQLTAVFVLRKNYYMTLFFCFFFSKIFTSFEGFFIFY